MQAGFINIHIEGKVQGHFQTLREIQVLVQDIYSYLQSCNHVIVSYTFREGNYAADWLTKLGLTIQFTVVWK